MSVVNNVLIVGAGIAGLTLASALRKRNIEVDLVEISPEHAVQGIGLGLQGPTLRALNEIGIIDPCVAAGFGISSMTVCDAQGRVLNTMPMPRLLGDAYPATVGIMRPKFQRILTEAARDAGVPLRLGVSVSELRQSDRGVEVKFSDASKGHYDLVVGADGIGSSIRELVFDSNLKPERTGQTVWRATVERPSEVNGFMLFYGPTNKAGFNPASETHMYVFLVENGLRNARIPADELPAVMRELLADFGGLVAQARENIKDPEHVLCRPIEVVFCPAPWFRGRVVLIGDAAHATTPHLASGAGMAIEDAIVLSEELETRETLPQALEAFQSRRLERSRMVYENSIQLGRWEMNPADPDADPMGLTQKSMGILAQPL